jgi:hypothetical protein
VLSLLFPLKSFALLKILVEGGFWFPFLFQEIHTSRSSWALPRREFRVSGVFTECKQ